MCSSTTSCPASARRVRADPEGGDAEVLAQRRPAQRADRLHRLDLRQARDLVTAHSLLLSSFRTTGSISSVAVDALFEVRRAGPVLETLVAELRQALVDLGAQLVVDGQPLVARGLAEELVVQAVEAPELLDRGLVVVDAQVDEDVGEPRVAPVPLDDEQRRGLLAAAVATRGLSRCEARQQSLGQRAFRRLEGLGEGVDRLAGDEDVALGGVAGPRAAACPLVAAGAGERGAAAGGVDDPELPLRRGPRRPRSGA